MHTTELLMDFLVETHFTKVFVGINRLRQPKEKVFLNRLHEYKVFLFIYRMPDAWMA